MVRRPLGLLLVVVSAGSACASKDGDPVPTPSPKESSSATTHSAALDTRNEAKQESPPAAALRAPAPPPPRSLAGKKVLHVGDSMVGGTLGLTRALEAKLTAAGAKMVRHTKVSESLTSFDRGPTLRDLLRTHDPDIVIVNLGANDASVPHPEVYARSISKIVSRIDDGRRECWWIGPPSWKGPDTGIVGVLRSNVGKCRFFDSSTLDLERTADGIHPNERGAARWADSFWAVFHDPKDPPTE